MKICNELDLWSNKRKLLNIISQHRAADQTSYGTAESEVLEKLLFNLRRQVLHEHSFLD